MNVPLLFLHEYELFLGLSKAVLQLRPAIDVFTHSHACAQLTQSR